MRVWDTLLQLQEGLYWRNRETFWYQKERTSGWGWTIGHLEIYQSDSEGFGIETSEIFNCGPCRKWEPLNYWEESSILAKDSERNTRWIGESIWIRRKGGNNKSTLMNADEGLRSADPEGVIKKRWRHSVKTRISCQYSLRKHPNRMWNVTTTKINSKLDFSKELNY